MTASRSVFEVRLSAIVAGLVVPVLLSFQTTAFAQASQHPTALARAPQDPTALAWVNQGLALLNGGTALSDVTLQATVTYTSGSDIETGQATLQALTDGYELMVLTLTGGQQQEVRNLQTGAWVAENASITSYGSQNCWTDASWFFPGLVFTAVPGNPQVGLLNLGGGTWNGLTVNHVQFYQLVSGQSTKVTASIQAFSTEDVYLDPSSSLPLAIDFNTHPNDNAGANTPVEIQFSNYQQVSGMSVPMQIQRLLNGSELLSISVTSVTVNSGLSPNLFIVP